METTITTQHSRLAAHLATPSRSGPVCGVVLCHGFPSGPRGAIASAATFPELADRIARENGCIALAFNCRGTGGSDGDFSIGGWLDDIHAAVEMIDAHADVAGVALLGVAEGGTLAMCEAASDARVRAIATLAAPTTLQDWAREPSRLLEYARSSGMIRTATFPESMAAWAREIAMVDALDAARRLPPRPVLVLHGSDDDLVPASEARELAEAAGDAAELHLVQSAGHELRHDPRAIASLLGWIDRLF